MRNSISQKNLEVLKRRFHDTWEQIEALEQHVDGELFSNQTYRLSVGKADIFPYGQTDGESFAEKWVEDIICKRNGIYIVSGFGTGLHIKHLLKKLEGNSIVIVVDFDIAWLKWLFSRKDCAELLRNERFVLFTNENYQLLDTIGLVDKNNLRTCIFSPLFILHENEYYRFFTEFCKQFDMRKKMQSTLVGDAELWQENAIKNLETLLNAPSLSVLEGKYKHLPLILVSAGPSLDGAIPFLKRVQDKAIIVSMNSSFRTLQKNGIHSHFSLAIDPRPTTFDGFRNQPIGDSILLTSFFVHPDVVQHFAGQIMTWKEQQFLSLYVYERLQLSPGPVLKGAGTVATLVGDLAAFLGCKKVCLVGQDLACTKTGQTHASDSIYNDNGTLFMDVGQCREWPGNTQEKVFVESKLYLYLQIFNQMADKFKDIEFINTSHLGAKIDNIPYVDYAEAEQWIGNGCSDNVSVELLKNLKNYTKIPSEKIIKILQPLFDFTKELAQLSFQAAAYHEIEPEPSEEHSRTARKGYAWADKINHLIDSNLNFYDIILNGKLIHTLYNYDNNVKILTKDAMPQCQKDWIKNREYYWALFAGSNSLVTTLLGTYPNLLK